MIAGFVADPTYQALINTPVGYVQTDLLRDYNGNSMMADFVDDAIYNYLNTDTEATNDVDMFFNNPGGIRTDWCDKEDTANPGTYIWTSNAADCQNNAGVWSHDPMLLTYGQMFTILPFGNQTIVGEMKGSQILELLHQSATLFRGALQPSGLRYKFFRYSNASPGPQPYGWGAYDVEVYDKATSTWQPLDLEATYKVGTNEFLAPAGQDGFTPFKYMTNITYWGDMLNAVNAYVEDNYTFANPYRGPNGDGFLDGRIQRNGDKDDVYEAGEIVPLTVLHHNDSHGNLDKGTYAGYTQLASLIKQQRAKNPDRTLLLSSGDNIQGDAMMYYFRTAPTGVASDGTPILDPAMHINPLIKAFNYMGYDAMTLGNHEFNFGKDVFVSVLEQANFPLLQANIEDDGSYGLADANILPYVEKTVGPEGIKVAILGIGNHRIPNYELPSNIPGLTFSNPITKAQELSDDLRASNDVLIALTHIGFTENPASVEVDTNVDTNLAATVTGLDAILGGHSHTDPAVGFGAYKYLPTLIGNPDGAPVLVSQALRYNNTLGEVSIGLMPDGMGGYEVVSQTGRYIKVDLATTPEDPDVNAIVDPYSTMLAGYNNTVIGETTTPIDTLLAYTQETNGANLQADASVYELTENGVAVDFHLSGAMSNRKVAATATPDTPASLKVADMFSLMPYENSLVVIRMNGPQIKAILERAYRNYYYYKYVPGYGGYSYYTTCMLDTNAGNQITYNDLYPALPNGNNVVSLEVNGNFVDFTDADTYYNVSTVNYLAAGSCNFNDGGVTLWPLNQIEADTQYYVRDAVINYVTAQGTVSPAIEGRLQFISDGVAPTVQSIVRADASPTNAASVDFTVTFSEAVTGVDTSDFALDTTGTLSGASVTGITGSGDTYTVTVSTGTGSGNLRLDVPTTATVKDVANNPLASLPYNTGEAYQVELTAPFVVSIVRDGLTPTTAASVDFVVTFSEDVTNVGMDDFVTTTTGTLSGTAVTGLVGSGDTYTVTVSTGAGSGTLRLDVPASSDIQDTIGNALTGLPYTGGEVYGVRIQTFADVPVTHWAWSWIERLHAAGVTSGCSTSPLSFCPGSQVNRAQMAVFVLKGKHGAAYVPPAVGASTGFSDVPTTHWAAAWIKQLAAEGISVGFSDGTFRPNDPVNRAQMAVFLLKAKHGAAYVPPAVGAGTGFSDVPTTHWAAAWIKQLAAEGISAGYPDGTFRPNDPVNRAQMAVFIVLTFDLP